MRVFLSAGETSGDAYAAALVRAIRKQGSTDSSVLDRIRKIAAMPDIQVGDQLNEMIELDSLDIVELVMALEDEFGIEIEDDTQASWKTVGDVCALASPKRSIPISFEGIGGPRLRAEGATIIADSSEWGAISIVQALGVVPKSLNGYYRAKRALGKGKPGLFIPIDFGYANIRLARHAKNRGWKVLYFIPPGSWRRDKQGKDLPLVTDAIVTPFSWSAEILNKMGAKAHWFGHPIKELLGESRHAITPLHGVAVLPGSRGHELEANLPILAEALNDWPEPLEFALAPTTNATEVEATWNRLAPSRKDAFTIGDTGGVLKRARTAVVCSGTATLEAALCRRPFVVIYRITESMRREAKLIRMKRPKYVALPNIILDRMAVPELVDVEATPEAVRSLLEKFHADSPERNQQLEEFEELDRLLGPANAISKAAELAIQLFGTSE